ncbi:MAG: AAA family ATPase, partial [Anaerolineae bacterium]|nr:AAA family ATPase [Anaerolineae bacterium]
MLKFPYGISDFYTIRTEGYVYIDRTDRIALVEEAGKQLVFLRPRRFGKSLWLSTLENYYDVAKAGEFAQLFGDLAIGRNPTPGHNSYFILRWDFS